MEFITKLRSIWQKNNSLLCIGLDPDIEKLPESVKTLDNSLFEFNKAIIDSTYDLVCAYKPNSAFYEAHGADGINQLKMTSDYLHQTYPEIPIILDFKRGDIGNTNKFYATFAFEYLNVDAVTLQPWQGGEALEIFFDYKDKGMFILDRTSNKGAEEFQNLEIDGQKLYLRVAQHAVGDWNRNGNCLLVVGATAPQEMAEIRQLVGDDLIFLVPGMGAQGGDSADMLKAGLDSNGKGLVINASRSILYSSSGDDFKEAARTSAEKLRDEINNYRVTGE